MTAVQIWLCYRPSLTTYLDLSIPKTGAATAEQGGVLTYHLRTAQENPCRIKPWPISSPASSTKV
jgi:hypothetical protein